MPKVVVSLCGKKRTGKESAFKVMLPYVAKPKEFQFATPLKKFCIDVLGLTNEQCYGSDADRETLTKYKWSSIDNHIRIKYEKDLNQYMTGREVLQVFGTDLMREQFYRNIWAEGALRAAITSQAKTCVLTDARFPNEVKATREAGKKLDGSIIIRLYRETGLDDKHDSEISLDKWDSTYNQRRILPRDAARLQKNSYIQITESMWKYEGDGLPNFDYFIDNNYTLDDLRDNMIFILKERGIYVEPTLS